MNPVSNDGTETYVKSRLAVESGGAQELLLHAQLLGIRLYIQAWVRFFVVAGIMAGTLGGKYVLGVDGLEVVLKELGYPGEGTDLAAVERELLTRSNCIRFEDDLTLLEIRLA